MNTIKVKSDKPIVVISIDEYEGMKETIEILSSYQDIASELKAEREKIDSGEFISYTDFKNSHPE